MDNQNLLPIVAIVTGGTVMMAAALILALNPANELARDLIIGGGGIASLGGTAYRTPNDPTPIQRRAAPKTKQKVSLPKDLSSKQDNG
jgi:hypothetical protein